MNRRQFLQLGGASLLAGCSRPGLPPVPPWLPVTIRRPGMAEGHWLRNLKSLPPSAGERRTRTVIIGSGIAGLTAAWRLVQAGYHDFVLLTGPEPFGNADGGRWQDVAYPRGAHYLPLPTRESTHVRELLQSLGVIEADAFSERPRYDERFLLHAGAERLLVDGHWQDGLFPAHSSSAEAQQHGRFMAFVNNLRGRTGRDGKPLFAIPVVLSSQDADWRALDRQTFGQWLTANGYTAPGLRWYLDYCCRDDYGLDAAQVSAWAGLHYFAARNGLGRQTEADAVLTWPEGLQALAQPMAAACRAQQLTGLALQVREHGGGVSVDYADRAFGKVMTLKAQRVICATPLHVAARLMPPLMTDLGFDVHTDLPPHAPWLVANLYLDRFPEELPGEEQAWDNVVFGSRGLGFVVATHQLIRAAKPARTVLTAYTALAERSPGDSRLWLQQTSQAELVARGLVDVVTAYGPQLWRGAQGLELTLRGHAMASPAPGYLSQQGLQALRETDGKVLFAHADLSGYSVFEEAAWWGWRAAGLIS